MFWSRLAVNNQTLCFFERLDLRVSAAEVVLILRVETAEAVCHKELLELADVVIVLIFVDSFMLSPHRKHSNSKRSCFHPIYIRVQTCICIGENLEFC